MRLRLVGWAVIALVALAGCQAGGGAPPASFAGAASGAVTGTPGSSDGPTASPSRTPVTSSTSAPAKPKAPARAPSRTFGVGVRQLNLNRGADRPLRTLVWYPTNGAAGGAPRSNATAAAGRFPLVLFSHGLHGSPEAYQGLTIRIAAAGFVVAAPAYPFTSSDAKAFNAGDMANQPADASRVISEVLKLDTKAGDLLAGHVDRAHVGAGGHSAGGFTTVGLLSGSTRDTRLKGAFVFAGASMGGSLTGPSTPTLFVHGDNDLTVGYGGGHAVYDAMRWPKAFLTIVGGDHSAGLFGSGAVPAAVTRTLLDFLRWTLYGDASARSRLKTDATATGTRYEAKL